MAWYGVNFVLGSGKHAYGSGAGGIEIVMTVVGLDMLFLAASTIQYIRHKPANMKRAADDDEAMKIRARAAEPEGKSQLPEPPHNDPRDPHIKFG